MKNFYKKHTKLAVAIVSIILVTAGYIVGQEKARYDIRHVFHNAFNEKSAMPHLPSGSAIEADDSTSLKMQKSLPNYRINQIFQDNLFAVEVTGFKTARITSPKYDTPKQAKGIFVYVNLRVKNVSHAPLEFGWDYNDEYAGVLLDKKQNAYTIIDSPSSDKANNMWYEKMQPNESATYSLIFDIPGGVEDLDQMVFAWANSRQEGFKVPLQF